MLFSLVLASFGHIDSIVWLLPVDMLVCGFHVQTVTQPAVSGCYQLATLTTATSCFSVLYLVSSFWDKQPEARWTLISVTIFYCCMFEMYIHAQKPVADITGWRSAVFNCRYYSASIKLLVWKKRISVHDSDMFWFLLRYFLNPEYFQSARTWCCKLL